MKCQILFSGKNKNISMCRLLKILPRVLSIKEMLKIVITILISWFVSSKMKPFITEDH